MQTEICRQLQTEIKFSKNKLFDKFKQKGRVGTLLSDLSDLIDQALLQVWSSLEIPADYTLIAIGSYGGGELFPHSSIKILLLRPSLCPEIEPPLLKQFIENAQAIDLKIEASICTTESYLEQIGDDLSKQTAVLSARYLAGNIALFQALQHAYQAVLDPQALFFALQREARQRHLSYQETPYALEPNCKEGPGGLRDLQSILAVAQAAGFGRNWQALFAYGLLNKHELRELKHRQKLLKTVRVHLHLLSHRQQDILTFELQPLLAHHFGFVHGDEQQISEGLMREYYWAVKAITQISTILTLSIEASLFPKEAQTTHRLSEHFYERQGLIEIADEDVYQHYPDAILETFLIYQSAEGVKGLAVRTLRALYNARNKMDAHWRNASTNREAFIKILQAPHKVTRALRLMNHTGVLGRYLLSFRRIIGQMQHDLFHVYAVDQHILMVVRYIRRFAILEYTHEFPFCCQLLANFEKPWVLVIAALFHDIAKGRSNNHAQLGSIEAKKFCRQHNISQEDSKLIAWLVENHLTLAHLAQITETQEPPDAEVILDFAHIVEKERYLTALYLLTVADLRGTNPKAWSASQGKRLEALYHKTLALLCTSGPKESAILAQRGFVA